MLLQTFHEFSRQSMSPLASVCLHAAMAGYLIAAVIALAALLQPARVRMAWADGTGAFATGALIAFFITRFVQAGTEPLQNIFEVVALSALFLALIYFAATRLRKLPAMAAFAYPAIVIVFLVDLMLAGSIADTPDSPLSNPLLVAHIVLTILAYGVFFMATVAAVMFLLHERSLKKHKDPAIMRSFPPLESLRKLVSNCLLIGLPLMTLGFALGFASFSEEHWAGLLRNPKVLTSVVLWLVLLAVVGLRRAGVLHGRRYFYMVLVGFVLVVATYVGLGIAVSQSRTPPAQAQITGLACSGL